MSNTDIYLDLDALKAEIMRCVEKSRIIINNILTKPLTNPPVKLEDLPNPKFVWQEL